MRRVWFKEKRKLIEREDVFVATRNVIPLE